MKVKSIDATFFASEPWHPKEWAFVIRIQDSHSLESQRTYTTQKAAIAAGKRFCNKAGWEIEE